MGCVTWDESVLHGMVNGLCYIGWECVTWNGKWVVLHRMRVCYMEWWMGCVTWDESVLHGMVNGLCYMGWECVTWNGKWVVLHGMSVLHGMVNGLCYMGWVCYMEWWMGCVTWVESVLQGLFSLTFWGMYQVFLQWRSALVSQTFPHSYAQRDWVHHSRRQSVSCIDNIKSPIRYIYYIFKKLTSVPCKPQGGKRGSPWQIAHQGAWTASGRQSSHRHDDFQGGESVNKKKREKKLAGISLPLPHPLPSINSLIVHAGRMWTWRPERVPRPLRCTQGHWWGTWESSAPLSGWWSSYDARCDAYSDAEHLVLQQQERVRVREGGREMCKGGGGGGWGCKPVSRGF